MRVNVHLRFYVDVDDVDEAWDIAESLEKAAVKKGYFGASGWITTEDRAALLGSEESPPASSAETVTRQEPGVKPMTFGGDDGEFITVGGEDGRSG